MRHIRLSKTSYRESSQFAAPLLSLHTALVIFLIRYGYSGRIRTFGWFWVVEASSFISLGFISPLYSRVRVGGGLGGGNLIWMTAMRTWLFILHAPAALLLLASQMSSHWNGRRDWNHNAYTPVLFLLSTIFGMDARHMTATAAPFHLLYWGWAVL